MLEIYEHRCASGVGALPLDTQLHAQAVLAFFWLKLLTRPAATLNITLVSGVG